MAHSRRRIQEGRHRRRGCADGAGEAADVAEVDVTAEHGADPALDYLGQTLAVAQAGPQIADRGRQRRMVQHQKGRRCCRFELGVQKVELFLIHLDRSTRPALAVEDDEPQRTDAVGGVVGRPGIAALLRQDDLAKKRPVVVVAQSQDDRHPEPVECIQTAAQHLVVGGAGAIDEVAADDKAERLNRHRTDGFEHLPKPLPGVESKPARAGRIGKVQIRQVDKAAISH